MVSNTAITEALAAVLGAAFQTHAHHSFVVDYDMKQVAELQGTVTKFAWRNPHCFLFIDVKSANGKTENWLLGLNNTVFATRAGWPKETFQPGDKVIISDNPTRTETKRLATVSIKRPTDGFSYQRYLSVR